PHRPVPGPNWKQRSVGFEPTSGLEPDCSPEQFLSENSLTIKNRSVRRPEIVRVETNSDQVDVVFLRETQGKRKSKTCQRMSKNGLESAKKRRKMRECTVTQKVPDIRQKLFRSSTKTLDFPRRNRSEGT